MNDRSLWREWPLAVFAVALQVACAFAFASTALDWLGRADEIARSFGLAVFPAIGIGVLASLLHVGRPLSSWRAVTNARQSRLSQEIIATVLFGGSALVYGTMCYGSAQGGRLGCGLVTVALGVIAVIANARVYRIPADPGWRKAWSIVSFASIALIAAVLLPILYSRL